MPHLHAALIPPPALLVAVQEALRATADQVRQQRGTDRVRTEVETDRPTRWSRLRKRSSAPTPLDPELGAAAQLAVVPDDDVYLRLAAFGSVDQGNTARLVAALAAAVRELEAPTVWLAGAVEPSTDDVVRVAIDGDLDLLRQLAQAVQGAGEPLGFFVDRRQYQPALAIASTTGDSPRAADDATAALQAFRGDPWRIDHVSVLRRNLAGGGPESVVLQHLPVGDG